MKKYIRTENGIYELNNDVYIENNEAFMRWFSNGQELESDSLGKAINQADTIEELCDKFVITFNNKSLEPKQFKVLETALDFLKDCDKKYCPELKGAIWTERGLIYVARMNEKGELELI